MVGFSIHRSASEHLSSSDENEEMTFVYEGSSSAAVPESKPKSSCLKKQKHSWSSDDENQSREKVGKKGDSEIETQPRPCLKKSNSRGEDLSDRSRKSSLSSRGDSNKPHVPGSSSRANYKR